MEFHVDGMCQDVQKEAKKFGERGGNGISEGAPNSHAPKAETRGT